MIEQTAGDDLVARTAILGQKRILVLSRDPRNHELFRRTIRGRRLEIVTASTLAGSGDALRSGTISLVLCDEKLQDGNYTDVLQQVRGFATHIPVVVFSRLADWDRYLKAMRAGAFDLILIPCRSGEIDTIVEQALNQTPHFR